MGRLIELSEERMKNNMTMMVRTVVPAIGPMRLRPQTAMPILETRGGCRPHMYGMQHVLVYIHQILKLRIACGTPSKIDWKEHRELLSLPH